MSERPTPKKASPSVRVGRIESDLRRSHLPEHGDLVWTSLLTFKHAHAPRPKPEVGVSARPAGALREPPHCRATGSPPPPPSGGTHLLIEVGWPAKPAVHLHDEADSVGGEGRVGGRTRELERGEPARAQMLLQALAEGRVSLTVAGRLAPRLTPENCDSLLQTCAGMTKRQVEELLVELKPKPEVSPGMRKQPRGQATATAMSLSPAAIEDARPGELPIGDAPSHAIPESAPRSRGSIEPCSRAPDGSRASPNATLPGRWRCALESGHLAQTRNRWSAGGSGPLTT